MLLSVTTTMTQAADLGYLLHKHPDRVQSFPQAYGVAHVFYPEASAQRCTAVLLLEVDPIALVRGRGGAPSEGFALGQYVNDRPYAASSLLSVALGAVFRTAISGRCAARPDLVDRAIPLEVHLPVLPCRGGLPIAVRMFAPLGWQVDGRVLPLDETVPAWGDSRYLDLTLRGELRLADALSHLYVLLPVLDDAKHYWVAADEVDKLVRAGAGWLAAHPDRELITRRYLAHQGRLTRAALARLAEADDLDPERLDDAVPAGDDSESVVQPLAVQRRDAVLAVLRDLGARTVADLGCGSGALTAELLAQPGIDRVVATDVSVSALNVLARNLRLERMTPRQRERLSLAQSSLVYRDERLAGLDAAVLMEVIEHVDPSRLPALEEAVFGAAAPRAVLVTTPNVEHNVRYPGLAGGRLRHRDHRFEWTRAQFAHWATSVADRRGYAVRFEGIGPPDDEVGPPTQLAVFTMADRTVSGSTEPDIVAAAG